MLRFETPLTPFEQRIFVAKIFGASPAEIAAQEGLAVYTVSHIQETIATKLSAHRKRGQSIYRWY